MSSIESNFTQSLHQSASFLTAVVANANGEIFELDGYAAVGMSGASYYPLLRDDTTPIPFGSEFMFLPNRHPVVFNLQSRKIEYLVENPFQPDEHLFAVAAFNSPGYVLRHTVAYRQTDVEQPLPLFSYGAVGWRGKGFRTAALLIDDEPRQDLRLMDINKVKNGVAHLSKKLSKNRLRRHLEKCALEYGCPAAKNFFLKRYEAPVPTSKKCNANCWGCISLQPKKGISICQERIDFVPTPDEISSIGLEHIDNVKQSVVSFGQGCEGDPLFSAYVIAPAIHQIRKKTTNGTINMNTNASLPDVLAELLDAGLDSIRVSLNSFQSELYNAYFRPSGYRLDDVFKSIEIALGKNKFVSINYLNCPGITDTIEEKKALTRFLKAYPIQRIQWRNLNFDPKYYYQIISQAQEIGPPLGMKQLIDFIRSKFPWVQHKYFNPPKELF